MPPANIDTGADGGQFVEFQLPGVQQPADNLLRQIRQADDAHVRPVVIDVVNHTVHPCLPEAKSEAVFTGDSEQPQKRVHCKGIPLAGNGKAHRSRGVACLTIQALDPALLLQQGDGVAEKLLALRRELHAPVAAGQHPNAQFVLKLPHRRGNPRLGQEQLLGRLVDGAAFGDLHDVLKLLKRHRKPPLPLSISLFYYRHFELVVKSLSKKLSTHPAKRILTALRPLCYSISRTKQKISVI